MTRVVLSVWLLCTVCVASAQTPYTPQHPVPTWAQEAVWYQIFPERFRNGDPANDPTRASLEDPNRVPATWQVTPWTGDWYAQAPWEEQRGPFYTSATERRYGGDLQGVIDQLDYLDSLGVTALYFNPVFYARSLHKYESSAFHHIDPYFGPDPDGDFALMAQETMDPATWQWTAADRLFLNLLREAKARGLRVIIDGVFNHAGQDLYAFKDVRARQQASPYKDWFVVTQWDDPATPDTDEFDWEGWWGYKPLVLFADNAEGTDLQVDVKAYVFAVTRRWMDPNGDGDPADGIDGWRLDVANEVPTGFWADWNALVRRLNPDAYTVAELWGDATDLLRDGGFTATMNYHGFAIPVHDALIDHRSPVSSLADYLTASLDRYDPATARALQNLLDSHDTDRLASMLVNAGLAANYDRDAGPRDTTAYAVRAPNADERALQRLIVTLQMTWVGAPMVYYGDEVGMWGGDDPDDRKPMVWADLTYADETADPLGRPRSPDAVRVDTDLLAFYQRAIALRTATPALQRGTVEVVAADDATGVFAFARAYEGEEYVVVLNPSGSTQRLPMPNTIIDEPLVPVFTSSGTVAEIPSLILTMQDAGITYALAIPARTAVVYRRTAAPAANP